MSKNKTKENITSPLVLIKHNCNLKVNKFTKNYEFYSPMRKWLFGKYLVNLQIITFFYIFNIYVRRTLIVIYLQQLRF